MYYLSDKTIPQKKMKKAITFTEYHSCWKKELNKIGCLSQAAIFC